MPKRKRNDEAMQETAVNNPGVANTDPPKTHPYTRKLEQFLEDNPEWTKFLGCDSPPGVYVTVSLHRSSALCDIDYRECYNLIKETSAADYKASTMGWHPRAKKEEMRHEDMWYYLVRRMDTPKDFLSSSTKPILGFLSFMLTQDDPPFEDHTVCYIYEVHLDASLRGKGVGSRLINCAEYLAKAVGLSKSMLTVFTRNKRARELYEKLGYSKDQCSPEDRKTRRGVLKADYAILSKEISPLTWSESEDDCF